MKLNIGSGPETLIGYINLDIHPHPHVDCVHDLNQPLPYPDGHFSEIHASHILEHLNNLITIMNELWRVMAPQGILTATVPWWSGEWAHGDPTHIHFFDHNSFNPFSDWYDRYAYLGIKGPWKKLSQEYQRDPAFFKNKFLIGAGFSVILAMTMRLQKP